MAIPERKPLSVEDEVRALLEEGRISDAKKLVETAGDQLPESLQEIFAPPRIRRVDERGVDRTPEFNWLKANGPAYAGRRPFFAAQHPAGRFARTAPAGSAQDPGR